MAFSLVTIALKPWSVFKSAVLGCLHFFKSRFAPPLKQYVANIDQLLLEGNAAQELYTFVMKGKNAKDVFVWLEETAKNDQKSKEAGNANFLLSSIYGEGVKLPSLTLQKDEFRSKYHLARAKSLLGENAVCPDSVRDYLEIFRSGSQSSYAYHKLVKQAETKTTVGSWASRILSQFFRQGVKQPNFELPPDPVKARKYDQKSKLHDDEIKRYVKKLCVARGHQAIVEPQLKKLADSGNAYAQLHYANYLKKHHRARQDYLPYYEKAAQKSDHNRLEKQSGLDDAKIALILDCDKNKNNPVTDPSDIDHYRFEIALNVKHKLSQQQRQAIRKEAKKGNRTSCLQTALCYLANHQDSLEQIQQAHRYLLLAEKESPQPFTSYQQELYDKVCFHLGEVYEDLFCNETQHNWDKLESKALKYLHKAMDYWQKIKPSSTYYNDVSFRISHFQSVLLKQESVAMATIAKSQVNDAALVHKAVVLSFENFWQHRQTSLTSSQQATVREHQKTNRCFTQLIRTSWAENFTLSPDNVLKKLGETIIMLNQNSCNMEPIAIRGAKELAKKIATLIKKQADHRQKATGPSAFFGLSGLDRGGPVLQVLAQILSKMVQELGASSCLANDEIVTSCFLDFAGAVCDNIMANAKALLIHKNDTVLPICKGAMYAN